MSYSFGVPSLVIWLSHITFGLYFIYLGYKMINYPKLKIDGLTILVVGALMTAYKVLHIYGTIIKIVNQKVSKI